MTYCIGCAHSALIALDGSYEDGYVSVSDGAMTEMRCFAPEVRFDPVTGAPRASARPCREINTISSCPWFLAVAGQKEVGPLKQTKDGYQILARRLEPAESRMIVEEVA